MPQDTSARRGVFISYSHDDKVWRDRLRAHLKLLERHGVPIWDDSSIEPGARWRDAIAIELARAEVAVFLVSSSFLSSDFIINHELAPALEAAASEGLKIFSVAVSASAWEESPLAAYQWAYGPPGRTRPLDKLTVADRKARLVDIYIQLRDLVAGRSEEPISERPGPFPPTPPLEGTEARDTRSKGDVKDYPETAGLEQIETAVGQWQYVAPLLHQLARRPDVQDIDLIVSYRLGDGFTRELGEFRERRGCTLRALFSNVWDPLLKDMLLRKYKGRTATEMRNGLKSSIKHLLEGSQNVEVAITEARNRQPSSLPVRIQVASEDAPIASYDLRLMNQRITYSYYRIDHVAVVVPLDMKRSRYPAPVAWFINRDESVEIFEHYLDAFNETFKEARRLQVYHSHTR